MSLFLGNSGRNKLATFLAGPAGFEPKVVQTRPKEAEHDTPGIWTKGQTHRVQKSASNKEEPSVEKDI